MRHVRKRRQVVHFVYNQQRAMAAELGQMQVGRSGDALVRGDVALQAAARVGRVVSGTNRQGVAQDRAPGRVGEGLFGLQPQAVARDHPADAVDDPAGQHCLGRDDRQQRFATARRDCCQNVGDLRRLAARDCPDDGSDLGLVGAQRTVRVGAKGQAGSSTMSDESESFRAEEESLNKRRHRPFLSEVRLATMTAANIGNPPVSGRQGE